MKTCTCSLRLPNCRRNICRTCGLPKAVTPLDEDLLKDGQFGKSFHVDTGTAILLMDEDAMLGVASVGYEVHSTPESGLQPMTLGWVEVECYPPVDEKARFAVSLNVD